MVQTVLALMVEQMVIIYNKRKRTMATYSHLEAWCGKGTLLYLYLYLYLYVYLYM